MFVTNIILYSFFCVVSIENLLEMIQGRISSFRGVKFSSPDLPDFSRCISNYGKKYQIMYSSEAVSTEIVLCTVDLLCNRPHHCLIALVHMLSLQEYSTFSK